MANPTKDNFLTELSANYGPLRKLKQSQSLFDLANGAVRIYIRYSRIHEGTRAFYGLRKEDLQQLEGRNSIICFLWDNQVEPLLVPFVQYEDVFYETSPAKDGQYKAQIYINNDSTELYISQAGRFNVESQLGWHELDRLIDRTKLDQTPELSHSQVQTMIGAIGAAKNYDIWIPPYDRAKLDWSIATKFACRDSVPHGFDRVENILKEVDVVWIQKGSSDLKALFEVEHSTSIYSALLRFNDIHLVSPRLSPRFCVVADEPRHALFVRQLNRPTFRTSGLSDMCSFLEYANVFGWHKRISASTA